MKLIITAGGQGTKLWPMSRENKPKQFQKVIHDKSLFRMNVEALINEFPLSDIFISSKIQYFDLVKSDAPEIPLENLILEPNHKKNSGPGTIYAILKVAEKFPNEPFFIVQADCIRLPVNEYIQMIKNAEKIVRDTGKIITGGNRPRFPEMGSDYLKLGNQIINNNNLDIYEIEQFIPRLGDYQKTKDLISNFMVSTHCNHLCWFPENFINSVKNYRPDWYEGMMKIRESFGKPDENEITEKIYSELEAGPLEEVTRKEYEKNGIVILLPFNWIDFGVWNSVYEFSAYNGGNVMDGDIISVDTDNSYIKGIKGKLIATLGVDNMVIVDTEDALFISTKERSNDIKKIIDELKEKNLNNYL